MKLIIINGACGVGKSTAAAKVHESIDLSLLLDVDSQRRLFSNYRENGKKYEQSGMAVINLVNAMLEAALAMGRDVVIDKMTYRPEILDTYYQIAEKYGAEVTEVILWAPKEVVMERAHKRGYKEEGRFTPEKCEFFWEQINKMKEERPKAIIIDTTNLSSEEVYERVKEVVN